MYSSAKQLKRLVLGPVLMLAGLLATVPVWAKDTTTRWQLNMNPGVTEVGRQIYDLHMFIFWICVVIGIIVFSFMFYSLWAYRKSNGHEPATFHDNTKVEIIWTIIPFFILFGMAGPATSTLLDIYNTDDAEIDILITGYQWKWKYEYINRDGGENISYFSILQTPQDEIRNTAPKSENYLLEVDEPVVIPVNKKVRFLITAADVLHAWWVPELAVKQDAIPGFINEAWTKVDEIGTYRGQCAELCGKDHGFMPIVVNVVSAEDYEKWISSKRAKASGLKAMASKTFAMEELMEQGKAVYDRSCAMCHGPNGEGGIGKAIAGSAFATGDAGKHLDVIVNGVPGTAMQAFGGQLNDIELAAVTTYQRNSWGNNMGDKVQPTDVDKLKKGQ